MIDVLLAIAVSTTNVRTNVSGEGSVEQSITVTVNGETTHIERNEPGSVEVQVENSNESVLINGQPITPTITTNKPEPRVDSGKQNSSTPPVTTISDNTGNDIAFVPGIIRRIANSFEKLLSWVLDKLQ